METTNKTPTVNSATQQLDSTISLLDQEAKINELAYFKAEARGFETGHELNDWLEAERDYFGG